MNYMEDEIMALNEKTFKEMEEEEAKREAALKRDRAMMLAEMIKRKKEKEKEYRKAIKAGFAWNIYKYAHKVAGMEETIKYILSKKPEDKEDFVAYADVYQANVKEAYHENEPLKGKEAAAEYYIEGVDEILDAVVETKYKDSQEYWEERCGKWLKKYKND